MTAAQQQQHGENKRKAASPAWPGSADPARKWTDRSADGLRHATADGPTAKAGKRSGTDVGRGWNLRTAPSPTRSFYDLTSVKVQKSEWTKCSNRFLVESTGRYSFSLALLCFQKSSVKVEVLPSDSFFLGSQ